MKLMRSDVARAFGPGSSPLDEVAALEQGYYATPAVTRMEGPAPPRKPERPKPAHYKIVCISLYNEDIAHLEAMVAELKRRGHTKANKSELIRFALAQVDLDKFPKAP